jgi:hypothetical protein
MLRGKYEDGAKVIKVDEILVRNKAGYYKIGCLEPVLFGEIDKALPILRLCRADYGELVLPANNFGQTRLGAYQSLDILAVVDATRIHDKRTLQSVAFLQIARSRSRNVAWRKLHTCSR